jgi:hypothetical protein
MTTGTWNFAKKTKLHIPEWVLTGTPGADFTDFTLHPRAIKLNQSLQGDVSR